MTEYVFENNAIGQLSVAIGTGDTTLFLESGDGALFPSGMLANQRFICLIYDGNNSEWVVSNGVSGDSMFVTRSATPFSFGIGANVALRLDKVTLDNFLQKEAERIVTSDPDGSLAALYTGEEVYQSVTGVWWKQTTGTEWKAMNV